MLAEQYRNPSFFYENFLVFFLATGNFFRFLLYFSEKKKEETQMINEKLQKNGAKFIILFLDEAAGDNKDYHDQLFPNVGIKILPFPSICHAFSIHLPFIPHPFAIHFPSICHSFTIEFGRFPGISRKL